MQLMELNWYAVHKSYVVYLSTCRHVHYYEDDLHTLQGRQSTMHLESASQSSLKQPSPHLPPTHIHMHVEYADHPHGNAHGDRWVNTQHNFHYHAVGVSQPIVIIETAATLLPPPRHTHTRTHAEYHPPGNAHGDRWTSTQHKFLAYYTNLVALCNDAHNSTCPCWRQF